MRRQKAESLLKRNCIRVFLLLIFTGTTSFIFLKEERPVLYIIGDSTVRNGDGSGRNGQWGWGSFIKEYVDTTKLDVQNHAIGGRSSRTFITEGRWEKILLMLKKGDYVMMQFGHNDAGPLDDTARARGTIRGTGSESKKIYNPITKNDEVVYTYGWYMRRYVKETKSKGAIPIICSPVPRNQWEGRKVKSSGDSYGLWAAQVAKEEGAFFIDLHNMMADAYQEMGPDKVAGLFYGDHTHTNEAGARLNAAAVIRAIKSMRKTSLRKYLVKQ